MQTDSFDNLTGLKEMLRDRSLHGTSVLFGHEDFLKAHYAGMITDSLVAPAARDFNLTSFEGDFEPAELSDTVSAMPFMSDKRLIILRDIDIPKLAEDKLNALKHIMSNLPSECILLFMYMAIELDMSTAKAQKLFSDAFCVCLQRATTRSLVNWVAKMLSERSRRISNETAQQLVEMCGNDMFTIKNECDKLAALADDEVTGDMLSFLAVGTLESDAFKLSEEMAQGNTAAAYKILSSLSANKAKPADVMGAVCSVYADLYRVAVAKNEGYLAMSLAGSFGYAKKRFVLTNAERRLKGRPVSFFREAMLLCADCDRKIKQSFTDMVAVEILIGKLAALNMKYSGGGR